MKRIITVLIFLFTVSLFANYPNDPNTQEKPKIGDELIISKLKNDNYKHIKFPRPNILVKRGAIVNYSDIYGANVVVTEVKENKYGRIDVKLVRTDGKKFFNKIKSLSANYFKALESGELSKKYR